MDDVFSWCRNSFGHNAIVRVSSIMTESLEHKHVQLRKVTMIVPFYNFFVEELPDTLTLSY